MKDGLTLPQLAKAAGIEFHRARYIVGSRAIRPAMRIRHYQVFDQPALEQVKREVQRVRQPRQPSGAGTHKKGLVCRWKRQAASAFPEQMGHTHRLMRTCGSPSYPTGTSQRENLICPNLVHGESLRSSSGHTARGRGFTLD
jgi:hypothetical protein